MAIIKHRKSAVPNKVPAVSGMTFGEIFVNYASGDGKSFLATLKNDESVAQFMEKGYNDTAYASKQLFEHLESEVITDIVLSDKVIEGGKKDGVFTIPIPQGAQGLAGAQGFKGAQGAIGTDGNRGTQGGTGLQGFQGAQGAVGTAADRGTQADTGVQGYKGTRGPVGTAADRGTQAGTGLQGYKGAQGAIGTGGDRGTQGGTGLQGYKGAQGAIGTGGDRGTQAGTGLQGFKGAQGATGTAADRGTQAGKGAQGYKGTRGDTGTAADRGPQAGKGLQGYKGTRGPVGTGGDRGTQGGAGLRGYQGTQGVVGTTGAMVNLTTGTTKSYLVAKDSATAGWNGTFYVYEKVYMQSGNLYATSDERFKNFNGDINIDFDNLKNIRKQYFNWKTGDVKETQIGTAAQDIMKYYPELVSVDEDGTLGVAYDKLAIVALAAIDKLHERIKILEDKLKDKE